MTFLEMAKDRFSVRQYADRPIEEDKLAKILEAAKHAPTAHNNQPQKLYILKSKEAMDKINSVCKCIFGAPMATIVCYDTNEEWKNPLDNNRGAGEVDASIVCTHMMMEAWELGIGTCWVGYFDPALVAKTFELPENIKIMGILIMGYPAEGCKPLEKMHNSFRPMDEMVTEL